MARTTALRSARRFLWRFVLLVSTGLAVDAAEQTRIGDSELTHAGSGTAALGDRKAVHEMRTEKDLSAGPQGARRRLWEATTALSASYLTGANGFIIKGKTINGYLGRASSTVGDVNNDGVDDFIFGEDGGYRAYVIFGRDWKSSSFPAEVDLGTLDGTNGFSIIGRTNAQMGLMCGGGGDHNNDGIADILVAAPTA
eukprot:Cvel_22668.t1-p1 / transcript=Cvel_22668.t1 / gene=Cvel_22668 / organism=Chromera_velia_CCMP2878 / gene_product=hypothetical protein / transcript_product=hypothetical protein / location=Cvel_scaffold2253:219-1330(-) / protein_length=196 / sequence_SO=supercontig / SO=protein_coding / is_pseudo=false